MRTALSVDGKGTKAMWRMLVTGIAVAIAFGAIACGSGGSDSSKGPMVALTSADCKTSLDLPTVGCHGKVKNLTSDNVSGLYVRVVWVDAQGNVMFKSNAQPIYGVILSGAEVDWDAASDYDPKAKDYRIEFLDSQQKVVSTVDQRPQ
jgi:hypothetical protein